MAELRLQIPDEVVAKIQARLGNKAKVTDIARDAITLFNWAVDERAKGRMVLSSEENGSDPARLAMASLDMAAARAGK
ncbi:hypothetical protein BJF93_12530 [Xaviernesmea oryzae]|uniref:Uncharacterized protein n=1 Tax=Xaviernesmea oryzae TaxID=464029 RepID=A0A1Q9B3K1_9HYPH|nr:hypothetical protein [Xaviernesmea oryzae]OLP62628.1 hypothetical protein BJF93_12530 [Xaviernesmea oryzae]SEM25479.1 hypothetical protein SAMN04487976_12511 [Xaviernesmea oryzae]